MPIGIFMQDFRTTRNHYVDLCPISTHPKPTFRATLRIEHHSLFNYGNS